MRKVLSWVLVLALVLGTFATSFAADKAANSYSDTAGKTCEGAVAVLSALDVVAGYPDGTYKPEKVVTRAEMATLIVNALDLTKYASGTATTFSDVPASHWAAPQISYAASMNVLSGYPDGTFKPDATVTYQEALTMIVRALGYQAENLPGAWPANFVNQARALGLLDDVDSIVGGANRGDVAIMLYNAIDEEIITYDKDGAIQYAKNGDSMVKRLGGVSSESKAKDKSGYGGVDKVNGIDADGYFVVNDTQVQASVVDLSEYLGAYVKAWFIENEDGDMVIGAINDVKSTFITGDYDQTEDEFTTDADKTYSFKNENSVSTFVGAFEIKDGKMGAAMTAAPTGNLDGVTLAVETSGSKITAVYSVLSWTVADEVQWNDDFAEDVADDQKIVANSTYKFDLNDDDAIDYEKFTLVGVDSLDKIAEDAIVTIYADTNKTITKLEVSTEKVEGKITKVNSSKKEFTINGTVYEKSDNCPAIPAIELGAEGTFFLNYAGDIAKFEKTDNATGNYAILLEEQGADTAYGKTSVDQIYMMAKDGKQTVYNFKDSNPTWGGEGAPATDTVANNGNASGKDRWVVEFDTNSSNEVTEITSYNTGAGGGLELATTFTKNGVMNGSIVSKEVLVFDASDNDPSEWTIGSLDTLNRGSDFDKINSGVYFKLNDGEIDLVVITNGTNTAKTDVLGFVDSYGLAYDENDDPIFEGSLFVDGAEKAYVTSDNKVGAANQAAAEALLGANTELYNLRYSGDAVESLTLATYVGMAAPVDDLGDIDHDNNDVTPGVDKDFVMFTLADAQPLVNTKSYTGWGTLINFANFVKVLDSNGASVELDKTAVDNYQYIGAAKAYEMTFDGKAFDGLAVGSVSKALKKGAYVLLLQTSDDNAEWDTVIYITKADADKILGV